MTKKEFLDELEECLRGEVSEYELADSMSYYQTYYSDEASLGKSEEEVSVSLGSPRLVARSIIDARGIQSEGETFEYNRRGSENTTEIFGEDDQTQAPSTMQRISHIAVLVGGFIILAGIIYLAASIFLPVLLILLVIGFLMRFFRGY